MKKQQALKHISVSILVSDKNGNILVVKPKEKEGWLLPGGPVERGERPSTACTRELEVETGVTLGSCGRLLCVDYRGRQDEYVMFLFDGGVMTQEQISRISLPNEHLIEYRFVTPEEALTLLRPKTANRLTPALSAQKEKCIAYLEDTGNI